MSTELIVNPVTSEVITAEKPVVTEEQKKAKREEAKRKAESRKANSDAAVKAQVIAANHANLAIAQERKVSTLVHRSEQSTAWVARNWGEIKTVAQFMYSLDVAQVAIDSAYVQKVESERVIHVCLRKNVPITENKRDKETGAYSAVTTIKKRYMVLSITEKFEFHLAFGFVNPDGETKQACESWLALNGILQAIPVEKLALHFRQDKTK